jgi:dihydropteroate synthase
MARRTKVFPPVLMKFEEDEEFVSFLKEKGFCEKDFSLPRSFCLYMKSEEKYPGFLKKKGGKRDIEIGRGKDGELLFKGSKKEIEDVLKSMDFSLSTPPMKIGKRTFCFGNKTYIMGIINVTPDSFYSNSRVPDVERAVETALSMVECGADIIDIGGESTRPGASPVSPEEEIRRILPVIKELRKLTEIPISVDTYKAKVAEKAIENGADMINDISGLRFDRRMVDVIKDARVPVVLMHTSGKPSVMQKKTHYKWLLGEISRYLWESIKKLKDLSELTILDPGIGFGKTPEQNLYILKHIEFLKIFGRPILIGPSRKSFIGHFGGGEKPEDRLEGTIAVLSIAVYKGVDFVRVHDVREAKKAISVVQSLKEIGRGNDGIY